MSKRPYYANYPKAPAIFVDTLVRAFDLTGIVEAHVGRDNSLFLDLAPHSDDHLGLDLSQVLKIAEYLGTPDDGVFFENSDVEGAEVSLTFMTTDFDFTPAFGPDREAFENLGTEPIVIEGKEPGDPPTLVTFEPDEDGVTQVVFHDVESIEGVEELDDDIVNPLPGEDDEEEAIEQIVYLLGVLEDEARRIKAEESEEATEVEAAPKGCAAGYEQPSDEGVTPPERETIDLGNFDNEDDLAKGLEKVFGPGFKITRVA